MSARASVVGSLVLAALVSLWSGTAAAADPQGPTWLAGPDRAYNCTHYLDMPVGFRKPAEVKPGQPMKLVLPRDKVMKFALSARPAKKGGKVSYEVKGAPPGAKLENGKLEWKVAGTSGQTFALSLVAVGDDGGRTPWPMSIEIASDRLFTAWSAGMGSVWPDCSVYVRSNFDVLDLDGDGKDDVMYGNILADDGTTSVRVMLQRGKLKFVEAMTSDTFPTPEIAADGTRLLMTRTSCCFMLSIGIWVIEGDTTASAGSWQVNEEGDPPGTIDIERDATGRITGVTQRGAGGGSVERRVWSSKAKTFVLP